MLGVEKEDFREYLINRGLSKRTIDLYLYYFDKFNYARVNNKTVNEFFLNEGNRNNVGKSFMVNLKKFLKKNKDNYNIDIIELEETELPRIVIKAKVTGFLREEEVLSIEKVFPGEKYKLMLLIAFYSGIRLKELLHLTGLSFNWNLWKTERDKPGELILEVTKGGNERKVYIPAWLMERIAKYCRAKLEAIHHYIFMKNEKTPTIDKLEKNFNAAARDFQKKLKKAGVIAGVSILNNEGKPTEKTKVNPHKLRHSFATHSLTKRGLSLLETKELLGHKDVSTTQRYTHVLQEDIKKKFEDKPLDLREIGN